MSETSELEDAMQVLYEDHAHLAGQVIALEATVLRLSDILQSLNLADRLNRLERVAS